MTPLDQKLELWLKMYSHLIDSKGPGVPPRIPLRVQFPKTECIVPFLLFFYINLLLKLKKLFIIDFSEYP